MHKAYKIQMELLICILTTHIRSIQWEDIHKGMDNPHHTVSHLGMDSHLKCMVSHHPMDSHKVTANPLLSASHLDMVSHHLATVNLLQAMVSLLQAMVNLLQAMANLLQATASITQWLLLHSNQYLQQLLTRPQLPTLLV
jgi:hypothetical protein